MVVAKSKGLRIPNMCLMCEAIKRNTNFQTKSKWLIIVRQYLVYISFKHDQIVGRVWTNKNYPCQLWLRADLPQIQRHFPPHSPPSPLYHTSLNNPIYFLSHKESPLDKILKKVI